MVVIQKTSSWARIFLLFKKWGPTNPTHPEQPDMKIRNDHHSVLHTWLSTYALKSSRACASFLERPRRYIAFLWNSQLRFWFAWEEESIFTAATTLSVSHHPPLVLHTVVVLTQLIIYRPEFHIRQLLKCSRTSWLTLKLTFFFSHCWSRQGFELV